MPSSIYMVQVLPDGSYSIGARQLLDSDASARFEHCLVGEDPESRARVVIMLKRLGEEGAWKLLNTEVRACKPLCDEKTLSPVCPSFACSRRRQLAKRRPHQRLFKGSINVASWRQHKAGS